MAEKPETKTDSPIYSIRVEGGLTAEWSNWFEGLTITRLGETETLISGPINDQSALFGLLKKIRDLGIPLISVNQSVNKNSQGENNEK